MNAVTTSIETAQIPIAVRSLAPASSGTVMKTSGTTTRASVISPTAWMRPSVWNRPSP